MKANSLRRYFISLIEQALDETGEFPEFDLSLVCEAMDSYGFCSEMYEPSQIAEAFYSALGIVVGRTL